MNQRSHAGGYTKNNKNQRKVQRGQQHNQRLYTRGFIQNKLNQRQTLRVHQRNQRYIPGSQAKNSQNRKQETKRQDQEPRKQSIVIQGNDQKYWTLDYAKKHNLIIKDQPHSYNNTSTDNNFENQWSRKITNSIQILITEMKRSFPKQPNTQQKTELAPLIYKLMEINTQITKKLIELDTIEKINDMFDEYEETMTRQWDKQWHDQFNPLLLEITPSRNHVIRMNSSASNQKQKDLLQLVLRETTNTHNYDDNARTHNAGKVHMYDPINGWNAYINSTLFFRSLITKNDLTKYHTMELNRSSIPQTLFTMNPNNSKKKPQNTERELINKGAMIEINTNNIQLSNTYPEIQEIPDNDTLQLIPEQKNDNEETKNNQMKSKQKSNNLNKITETEKPNDNKQQRNKRVQTINLTRKKRKLTPQNTTVCSTKCKIFQMLKNLVRLINQEY